MLTYNSGNLENVVEMDSKGLSESLWKSAVKWGWSLSVRPMDLTIL